MSKKLHSSSVTHPELEPRLSGPRAWDRNYHAMQSPTLSTRKWELGRLNNWPNYIGPPPLQITELSKNHCLFVCLFKLIPIAFSLCMRWWWLLQSPVCILCVHFKLLSKSLQNSPGFQCLWWQNSFTFCVFAWIILLKHIQVNLFVLSWREMEKECQAFPLPFQSVFLMNIPLLSYEQTISVR